MDTDSDMDAGPVALVRTSIQLTPEQRRAIDAIGRGRQLSRADVVREAVREYLTARATESAPESVAA